jgi:Flp pilus assembly protein TadD/ketosteroid isomerase-like protein
MAHPLFSALAAIVVAAALTAAHADSLQDAQRLMKQGQLKEALEHTEQILSGKPKDPQARFLKGLILTEMNRPAEAIAVFTKLTEDYPELPEPYNNLAVLYAQQRQYDKAKTALEMAIRTHPAYAIAYENLGDIYTRMASQAYDKALQLDSSNVGAQNKLALIRELMGTTARQPVSVRPAAGRPQIAAAPAEPNQAAPEAKAGPKPAAAPAPEVKAAEAKPRAAAEPRPVEPGTTADGEQTARKAVADWAAAWSRKDVKAYLAHYARDFQTPGGEAHAAWEAERAQRIAKPRSIQVTIEDLEVTMDGADKAVASFRQHYRAPGFKSSTRKTLVLVKRDGKWLIQQERIGS